MEKQTFEKVLKIKQQAEKLANTLSGKDAYEAAGIDQRAEKLIKSSAAENIASEFVHYSEQVLSELKTGKD